MNFIFLVLKRLFFSRQSNFFFRITNLVSIISLSIGIASLNIVLSSVSGFENKIFEKLSSINGYSTINNLFQTTFDKLEIPLSDIVQEDRSLIFEYVERPAIIKSQASSNNVIVYGIKEDNLNHFTLLTHTNQNQFSNNDVIIGNELANKLEIQKGDPLILLNPLAGQSIVNKERFLFLKVKDIYSSGIYDYDSRLIFMPIEVVQSYFNINDHISGWMVFDESLSIQELDLPFYQINLKDRHSELFRWINTQKWPIIFIFSLIALVSYFNLMSSINILFYEKRFNLAIMKTYGMSNRRLSFLFTIQGVVLALIGSILGILLSFIVILLQEKFHIISLSENIYFVSYLPMLFSVKNSLYILAISVIASVVFSSIALLQILSINPSKILKN
ncbi:MAG: FtsX-like permease family protein [Candidatus Neomarinimicrobiota bacterium]|nr:FtsX-like permease family protein [Candidatus Neomarinimicrobiota bacterium]MED5451085.1 FtsX-like permease family protein [Candidatus Neomarinimicrobiota bacterium]MEE3301601.1 FtsX-like permease family protein [Candidatus Neomarinimicrobiota bacterium]